MLFMITSLVQVKAFSKLFEFMNSQRQHYAFRPGNPHNTRAYTVSDITQGLEKQTDMFTMSSSSRDGVEHFNKISVNYQGPDKDKYSNNCDATHIRFVVKRYYDKINEYYID